MKRFKEFIYKILFPPVWVIVLSSVIGFPAVIISLKFLSSTNPVSCISYVLSAYALTVLCANFPRAKRRRRGIAASDEHDNRRSGMYNYGGNGCFYDRMGKQKFEIV